MPASFPTAVKTFASRADGEIIHASHVGDLQDEVNAIEDSLLNGGAKASSLTMASLTLHSTLATAMDETLTASEFGVQVRGASVNGNTYVSIAPPSGSTASTTVTGAIVYGGFADSSNFSAGVFGATSSNVSGGPYVSVTTSKLGSGSVVPIVMKPGGHFGPMFASSNGVMHTTPWGGDTNGLAGYITSSAAQGDIVLGAAGGNTIWQTKADHSGNYRMIGNDGANHVVLSGGDKDIVIGSGGIVVLAPAQPTIFSGFGSGPSGSVTVGTGVAFVINVGGGSPTGGVIVMPTTMHGWIAHAENITAAAAGTADCRMVQIATTANTITLQFQTVSTGAPKALTENDQIYILAFGA